MSDCPFPPPGGYLNAIRTSSCVLRELSGVTISHEGIQRFLKSKAFSSTFDKLSQNHGLALPLNFPSQLSELNVISVLSLVNFGSGFRVPLHEKTGRGAWDSIRALILGLYISSSSDGSDLLSAKALKDISTGTVANMMNIPTHIERPHESIPGVIVGEVGGPLFELVKLVTSTLNETGEILISQGYPDLGSFILEVLKEGERVGKRNGKGVDVETVLEKIVGAIPAFRDMALVNGQPIYVFKKALFLLHGIQQRLGLGSSGIPALDASNLPIFADNVIPSILVHLGVIDLSNAKLPSVPPSFKAQSNLDTLLDVAPKLSPEELKKLKNLKPKEGPILTVDDSYVLRAAAIDACEIILEEAHKIEAEEFAWLKKLTLPQLDAWLWAGAKDRPDYRELERFVFRDTNFF
ncbi:hypothetical protein M422DRAFT_32453 [Sphaerobolus stellatus SS14]|uniref:Queuosine 5'-phosphate N-glycosylase/hydrolase n=1 Tax=Sphaerobolus stellatus (strain SS14) TaxID=990650 RepID=A0A0C9UY88_SPHS4|nr:hypothetical protein M422DRAFT_32453 [Sphaerobolus stellatus SS14]